MKLDVEDDIVELPIEVKTALSSDNLQKCTNYRVALITESVGARTCWDGYTEDETASIIAMATSTGQLECFVDTLRQACKYYVDIALSNYIKLYLVNLFCTSPRKISRKIYIRKCGWEGKM